MGEIIVNKSPGIIAQDIPSTICEQIYEKNVNY